MATVNLGKVAFTWKGAWSASTTYSKQDVVSMDGSSYVCVVPSSTNVDPVSINTDWELFAKGVSAAQAGNGGLIYSDGTTLQTLVPGSPGQVLQIDGVTGLPEWTDNTYRSSVRVAGLMSRSVNTYRKNMVLMEDGMLKVWGYGAHYQLGQGTNTNNKSYPTRVAFPASFPGVKMPASINDDGKYFGMDYAYVSWCVDTNGHLWTWGQNTNGKLGSGSTGRSDLPVNRSLEAANSIFGKTIALVSDNPSPGYAETGMYVLCTDGTVHYCGYNGHGQAGQGNTTAITRFVQLSTLFYPQVDIASNGRYGYGLFLDTQGVLRNVGYNGYNTFTGAANNSIPQTIPLVGTGVTCAQIMYAGMRGIWVKDSDGSIQNWGNDTTYGFLGRGSAGAQNPGVVMAASTADIVEVLCVGDEGGYYATSYMRAADGTIYAAGYNGYGQLADGTTNNRFTYSPCQGFPTNVVKMIGLGNNGSYQSMAALTADGKVFAVGYNGNGQLGVGDTAVRNVGTQVPIQQRVIDIAPCGYNSESGMTFLLEDGSLLQSGYGGDNQMPDDDAEASYVPQNVIF